MKVAQLRKVLVSSAVIHDKAGQGEVARNLNRLADALKPAEKGSVLQLIEKLTST